MIGNGGGEGFPIGASGLSAEGEPYFFEVGEELVVGDGIVFTEAQAGGAEGAVPISETADDEGEANCF